MKRALLTTACLIILISGVILGYCKGRMDQLHDAYVAVQEQRLHCRGLIDDLRGEQCHP